MVIPKTADSHHTDITGNVFLPCPACEDNSSQTSTLLDQTQPRQLVVQVMPDEHVQAIHPFTDPFPQATDLTVVAAMLDPVAPLQAEPPHTEPLPQS